jgi:hypothetical protein
MLAKLILCWALLSGVGEVAYAEGWVSIAPDHGNLLYGAGEKAVLSFVVRTKPTDEDYKLVTYVHYEGMPRAYKVDFQNGVGFFTSPVLTVGEPEFVVEVKLVGPSIPPHQPWEQTVQWTSLRLKVQPNF